MDIKDFNFKDFKIEKDIDMNRILDLDADIALEEFKCLGMNGEKTCDNLVKYIKDKIENYTMYELASYIALLYGTSSNDSLRATILGGRKTRGFIKISKKYFTENGKKDE